MVEPLGVPEVQVADGIFALGVASGDPDSTSVALWTRLVGELPDALDLVWEMAYDDSFAQLAATGSTPISIGFAHSAHVVAEALPPGSEFFYRFKVGSQISPVGRTRTMAAVGSAPSSLRLAVSSCQLMETGNWAAHDDIARADVDLVIWLGDFIYGGGGSSQLEGRAHQGPTPVSLGAYRDRYAQYRRDPALQASSAAHPWVATWDDNEVENDYGSGVDPDRRQAAYQAWWEHMPTRLSAPGSSGFDVYRSIDAGTLCRIDLLDVRQYADGSTLLGDAQRQWLTQALDHDATWTIVGSPVLLSGLLVPIDSLLPEGQTTLLPYSWDGYPEERAWLAGELAKRPNRICVSGDLHVAAVLEVTADPADRTLTAVATELMAPPISSTFPDQYAAALPFLPLANSHIGYLDNIQGWMLVDVQPGRVMAEFRSVVDIGDPASPVEAGARYEIRAGDPTPFRL
jgi:alkaline phosphatase D